MIMSHDPDADGFLPNVVEEMIRKALEVAASQPACIEVEKLWIREDPAQADLKFG